MKTAFTTLLFGLVAAAAQAAEHPVTNALAKAKDLGIAKAECAALEKKVGQLLFIFVDGVGSKPAAAIHPEYIKAVADMNIGGVRLNSDGGASASLKMFRDSIAALDAKVKTPPFIGIDNGSTDYTDYIDNSKAEVFTEKKIQAAMKNVEVKFGSKFFDALAKEVREQVKRDLAITQLLMASGKAPTLERLASKRSFGLGTYSGIIGTMGKKSRECFHRALYLDAFLHKMIHVNTALGPTVDPSNRDKEWLSWWSYLSTASRRDVARRGADTLDIFSDFGLATTLKHFPYTPVHFDLHYMNEAVTDSPEEVMEVVKVFSETNKTSKNGAAFVMTTHLLNPNFDSNIATTSKKWLKLLRKDLGYQGIIVTDGINMVHASKAIEGLLKKQWKEAGGKPIKETDSLFAVLSILAGNDMVIVDNSLGTTKAVFKAILREACQNSPLAAELRGRIEESHARITAYKEKNAAMLRNRAPLSDENFMNQVLNYYQKLKRDETCPDRAEFDEIKKKIRAMGLAPPAPEATDISAPRNTLRAE